MNKIPLYVSGRCCNKYTNIYKNTKKINEYFIPQNDHEGYFGLFGKPFYSVFKDRTKEEKYYFPLIVSISGIADVIEHYIEISKNVLSDLKRKKCKILVVCPFEGWSWDYWQFLIDKVIKKYPFLTYKHFVVLNGNLTKHSKISSVYFNFFERQCVYQDLNSLQNTGIDRILNNTNRNYKFLYMNRRPHYFRIAAVSLLFDDKEKGMMSLGLNGNMHKDYYEYQVTQFKNKFPLSYEVYDNINLKSYLPLVIHDGINAEQDNPVVDNSINKFYDSYLHIVAETFQEFSSNRAFFSEKIFKPIMFMQPFVLIGEAYGLENLKKLGYCTFDKFIDESYDTILDDEKRLYASINSAKEFYNKSKEELDSLMAEMMPILNHNIAHLQHRCLTYDKAIKDQLLNLLIE